MALLSALLMWIAWPPHNWFAPLLLIAMVPLFIALDHIDTTTIKKKGKLVFLTAGATFLVWNTASIYWVYNAISSANADFIDSLVSFLVSLIPYGLGALLMTFAFWLHYRLKFYVSKSLAYLGLISFYIAMEYLHQTWDLSFPWMSLGNGFAGMHEIIQWYEYTGIYGGSIWVLLSNIIAFESYKAWTSNNQKKLQATLLWATIVTLPIAFSLFTYFKYEEKEMPVNIVVVQPNIDPYEKFGNISPTQQVDILTKLSKSVAQVNTEYFIWPETAIASRADEDQIRTSPEFLQAQQFLSEYKNATLISGLESYKTYRDKATVSARHDERSGLYWDGFNSAIQIENSSKIDIYHKSKLVPGVEKMPFPVFFSFLSPVFKHLGGSTSSYGWQDHPAVFYAHSGIGVSPVICYESIWGNWIAESVENGAQFIAIITNDGWWGNTSGKDQHLLYAKLRAIETRRWIARSANTGISAFINQRGDIVQQSEWWTSTALKADINLNDKLTFYVSNADILPKMLSFVALLLALFIPYNKWLRKS